MVEALFANPDSLKETGPRHLSQTAKHSLSDARLTALPLRVRDYQPFEAMFELE
jgi:hypothetical protein